MQRRHHLGALADRAADPLDRTRAHVADREYAGHRRFQHRRCLPVTLAALCAGHHKAAAIDHDAAAIEPAGGGIGADEQEQVADIEAVVVATETATPAQPPERAVIRALERDHPGVEHQHDVRRRLDAFDQIARHAGAEAAATDHHVDLARVISCLLYTSDAAD